MEYRREELLQRLRALAEPKYKAFMAPLLPTVDPGTILGVRLPVLRKLAGELRREGQAQAFLSDLPHGTLEENHLHSFLIDGCCRDFSQALRETERFLPYIDNWAVCDSFQPRALGREKDRLYPFLLKLLASDQPYAQRLSLVWQLSWYLGEDFAPEMLEPIARLRSKEYYVNMAAAWYWSMALAFQYEAALPWFLSRHLDPWVHNKAIQKARESRCVEQERKQALKALRIGRGEKS